MMETQAIGKFDHQAVPPHVRQHLAREAIKLYEKLFSMPGVEEEYRAWKNAQQEKQAAEAAHRKE